MMYVKMPFYRIGINGISRVYLHITIIVIAYVVFFRLWCRGAFPPMVILPVVFNGTEIDIYHALLANIFP